MMVLGVVKSGPSHGGGVQGRAYARGGTSKGAAPLASMLAALPKVPRKRVSNMNSLSVLEKSEAYSVHFRDNLQKSD